MPEDDAVVPDHSSGVTEHLLPLLPHDGGRGLLQDDYDELIRTMRLVAAIVGERIGRSADDPAVRCKRAGWHLGCSGRLGCNVDMAGEAGTRDALRLPGVEEIPIQGEDTRTMCRSSKAVLLRPA